MKPKISVWIAMPGAIQASCLTPLVALIQFTMKAGFDVQFINGHSSNLITLRDSLVKQCLDGGADYILMLDSDMIIPATAIMRLYEWHVPVALCNYVKRNMTLFPLASLDDKHGMSSVGQTGLERVHGCGLGATLVDVSIFSQIEYPWFGHMWLRDTTLELPHIWKEGERAWPSYFEDSWFFRRLHKAGIPVYCDHSISQQVFHMGTIAYGHEGVANL